MGAKSNQGVLLYMHLSTWLSDVSPGKGGDCVAETQVGVGDS